MGGNYWPAKFPDASQRLTLLEQLLRAAVLLVVNALLCTQSHSHLNLSPTGWYTEPGGIFSHRFKDDMSFVWDVKE